MYEAMRKEQPKVGNTLDTCLFSLAIDKPRDTNTLKYTTLGRYFGRNGYRYARRDFDAFCKKFETFINSLDLDNKFFFNKPFYSWLIIEVSKIDGEDYLELSVNDKIFLPIAGKQLSCIEMEASKLDMSVSGFAESINFILNDTRTF
jgi:hypothetical protein